MIQIMIHENSIVEDEIWNMNYKDIVFDILFPYYTIVINMVK